MVPMANPSDSGRHPTDRFCREVNEGSRTKDSPVHSAGFYKTTTRRHMVLDRYYLLALIHTRVECRR